MTELRLGSRIVRRDGGVMLLAQADRRLGVSGYQDMNR
jgi:hypothetical protein